ncbi:MAG: DUF4835 family protein, partial [Fulvivirga sp.]|nr:DUF4835 family protein [Fulvivirga sp.]
MRKLIILTISTIFSMSLPAQELDCKITVNADQVQTSDRSVFEDMEKAFTNFMNNNKWTDDNFESFERIKC